MRGQNGAQGLRGRQVHCTAGPMWTCAARQEARRHACRAWKSGRAAWAGALGGRAAASTEATACPWGRRLGHTAEICISRENVPPQKKAGKSSGLGVAYTPAQLAPRQSAAGGNGGARSRATAAARLRHLGRRAPVMGSHSIKLEFGYVSLHVPSPPLAR